jgi:hypothetical protein
VFVAHNVDRVPASEIRVRARAADAELGRRLKLLEYLNVIEPGQQKLCFRPPKKDQRESSVLLIMILLFLRLVD